MYTSFLLSGLQDICCTLNDRTFSVFTLVLTISFMMIQETKTNSVALSLQVNYTDLSTTTGWRILVQTFVDRRVSLGQLSETPHRC
jgi:hypothetical protein